MYEGDRYRISLNLCSITSNILKGSFRYFYRMFMKICSVNHISLALLYLSVVELLRNRFFALPYLKTTAKIIKALACLCLKMGL